MPHAILSGPVSAPRKRSLVLIGMFLGTTTSSSHVRRGQPSFRTWRGLKNARSLRFLSSHEPIISARVSRRTGSLEESIPFLRWFIELARSKKLHYAGPVPAVFFPPSPLSVVPVAIQILVKRRMTYDTQKYLGETCCSSNAEFAVDCVQRHKHP